MKITKQRLKEIIREELEFVGASIDQFAEPEVEDDSSNVAELLGTPEGTAIAKMMARKIIDQFASFPELADAIEGIDRDEVTARAVAAMRANPLFDPTSHYDKPVPVGDTDGEMELEEYRGEPERRSTYRGEPERHSTYRPSPEEKEAEKRKQNARQGALGSANTNWRGK
jgi:hypothetical protein